jgi:hypothetical protein
MPCRQRECPESQSRDTLPHYARAAGSTSVPELPVAPRKGGGAVDRCALFVDASYVLADGAMAVHGTRRAESVSWDYAGLVRLLSSLARERCGLPVLRCYWYEATVDGRRTPEQDALADLPGIKLRVAKIRPGRREGAATEIHRDLTTLARNNAVSDAVVVSAEEDLAQVIADVQDLGMRVALVHIAVDGNWTISRALRQESDDIIEIGAEHLRPYVELIAGAEPAEPARPQQPDPGAGRRAPVTSLANGHSAQPPGAAPYQEPAGPASHPPPAIYTAPVVAEYQRPPLQPPASAREAREARESRDDRPREDRPAHPGANGGAPPDIPALQDGYPAPATSPRVRHERGSHGERGPGALRARDLPAASGGWPGEPPPRADVERPEPPPAQRPGTQHPGARARVGEEVPGYSSGPQRLLDAAPGGPAAEAHGTAPAPAGQLRRLYGGPQQTVAAPPGYPPGGAPTGASLAEAVQAAHEEGQEFGSSVARDAPALWLEAVLARKPRMPSDLEARLLQGSALPIDFLLHDEVRHALRRGFWDALERTRR